MRTKIFIIVIIMITLCTCISFSNDLSAKNMLRIFASLYSPMEQTRQCSDVMTFGNEYCDEHHQAPNTEGTPQTAENTINTPLTGQKIYK